MRLEINHEPILHPDMTNHTNIILSTIMMQSKYTSIFPNRSGYHNI